MPDLLRSAIVAASLSTTLTLLGCGESAEPPAAKSANRQIEASSLPALGEYTPPLDGGRIEIAGPADWELLPRKSGYVVLFRAASNDDYPMILVKADDSSGPLTSENVAAFASALGPSAQPVAIGDRVGALQSKRGKEPGSIDSVLEQLIFTTVIGERTYALELRARQGRIEECQDMLFAVVAGMRQVAGEPPDSSGEAAPAKTDRKKSLSKSAEKELDELFEVSPGGATD